MTNITPDTDIRTAVYSLIEEAVSQGKEIPSIRMLRTKICRGSFSDITAFVKEWRSKHCQQIDVKPTGFDETSGKALSDAVWAIISPVVSEQVKTLQDAAASQLEIERTETQKLVKNAEEMLAEAESIKKRFAEQETEIHHLREELAKLRGALEMSEKELAGAKADYNRINSALNKAIQNEVAAKSKLEAYEKLLSLPKPTKPSKTKTTKKN